MSPSWLETRDYKPRILGTVKLKKYRNYPGKSFLPWEMGWEEGFAFSSLVRRWQWQVPVLPVPSLGMDWDGSVAIPGPQAPSPMGIDGKRTSFGTCG